MTDTWSTSQNNEKITALTKITDHHDQALQEIHKQLQFVSLLMQKMVESEERRQQSGPQGYHVPSNSAATESALVSQIKPLKFEFPRFQGDDPAC